MFHLSHLYRRLVVLYFRGKEQELRNGISKHYQFHRFESIRSFDPKEPDAAPFEKITRLANQTTLTFGVNFDFEIESSVLEKSTHSRVVQKGNVPFSHVRQHLSQSERRSPVKQLQREPSEPVKEIDLRGAKYNMLFQLGQQNIRKISDKSGFVFRFSSEVVCPTGEDATARAYESENIALFYLKDVAFPPIKPELI